MCIRHCNKKEHKNLEARHETLGKALAAEAIKLTECKESLIECQQNKDFDRLREQLSQLQRENEILRENGVKEPLPPAIQRYISADKLRKRIRNVVGSGCQIILADVDYKITTVSEFKRFVREVGVYKMVWRPEGGDCDDFTRKLKGELVCEGWWWQPALDVWHKIDHPDYNAHSQFLTTLIDDETGEENEYVIEPQQADLFEIAEEFFEEFPAFMVKQ